jgi:hypothetical protein
LTDLPQLKRTLQDIFECGSSQMTFEAIMKAEMKSRWPDELRTSLLTAVVNKCEGHQPVVLGAMRGVGDEIGNLVFDPEHVGGYSGHVNKWMMNRPHSNAIEQ